VFKWVLGSTLADRKLLYPSQHAVLPRGFHRNAFSDSLLSTQAGTSSCFSTTPATPFVATHSSFLHVLGPAPTCRVIAQKGYAFAHEAGVYIHETGEVWFTSNLLASEGDSGAANSKRVEISKVQLDTGLVTVMEIPSVVAGNGACPYGDYILFCDQGQGIQDPSQLVLVDPKDPTATIPLLNNFHGRPFNSLNDVIVLPPRRPTSTLPPSPVLSSRDSRGTTRHMNRPSPGSTVWFTDPTYGHEQGFKRPPELPAQVYMFNPETGDVRAAADGFDKPNGIAFSPDGLTCYITDTSHIRGCGNKDPSRRSSM
jgi:gluconolactonase